MTDYVRDDNTRCGLWKHESSKGTPCLKGRLEKYWVYVFNNTSPDKGPNDPTSYLKMYPKQEWAEKGYVEIFLNLFDRTSKKGSRYFGGEGGGKAFHVYPVREKKNPRGPDFNLIIYDKSQHKEYKEGTQAPEMPATPQDNPSMRERGFNDSFEEYPEAQEDLGFTPEPEEEDVF